MDAAQLLPHDSMIRGASETTPCSYNPPKGAWQEVIDAMARVERSFNTLQICKRVVYIQLSGTDGGNDELLHP